MLQSRIEHADVRRFVDATGRFADRSEVRIEPLAGDVSTRCYYRVEARGERAIAAYYPPDLRDAARRFERSTALLENASVRVPAILDFDREAGFMLLEDLGAETLFDRRDRPWSAIRPYLEAAHEAGRRVSAIDPAELADLMPPLDAAVLERELQMTWDVFLAPNGLVADEALGRRLRSAFAELSAALEAPGLVPCHRDFMARNLVPIGGVEVGVLDHQDLRLGPAAYDAASLFNDSLYPTEDEIEPIAGGPLLASAGYHRAVAQRALKIVGTFASFARRGQPRHLPLIPVSLRRALDHLAALPESAALAADLERRWARALC